MDMDNDSLTQIQIEFDERLAALTMHYQQTLRYGGPERLPQNMGVHPSLFKRCQSFLLSARIWTQQHLFPQPGQKLSQDIATALTDEDEVILVDAEYRVIEADSAQILRRKH